MLQQRLWPDTTCPSTCLGRLKPYACSGAHGKASRQRVLYAPAKKLCGLNKPMTDLIAGTLGFLQVDAPNKELVTFSKEGCCYHETTHYLVRTTLASIN